MKKIIIILICLITIAGCQKPKEPEKEDYKEMIAELLEKNYLLSLFANGVLELEESTIKIEGKTYNLVKNSQIKSLNELNSLLEEIYVPEKYNQFHEELYAKKEFLETNNKIYVNDQELSCDIGSSYDFTNFKISEETDKHLIIDYEDFSYYVFIRENKVYLNENVFKCLDIKKALLEEDQSRLDNLVD